MRAIGFAGWSGAGKTTLIKGLIPELNRRGLSVSTIKHAHHGFDVDRPGKDSYEHRAAGAARAADGRVAAEDHVVERDLRRGRAARRVVRHEQPAPEPRAAAAARAALGDRVLDRQI